MAVTKRRLPPGQERLFTHTPEIMAPHATPPGQQKMRDASTAATNAAMPVPTRNAPPGIGAAESIAREKARKRAAAAARTSSSNPAPDGKAAAAQAAAAPTKADLIANYNLERAKILQGMAPDIRDIYSKSQADLTSTVGGLSEDLRSRLFGAGTETQASLSGNLGGIDIGRGVADAYKPGATADAAYALGAAFPGESLAKQGAGFGAAAAFAPAAALTEGSYALNAEIAKEAEAARVANKDLGKISAANSKLLGYLVDAYGNPITGPNGKPVKLPEAQMTPYQKATLDIRKDDQKIRIAQFDYERYKTDRAYQRQLDRDHVGDIKWAKGFDFQSAKAAAAFELASAKFAKQGKGVDAAASRLRGHIVLDDGSEPKMKNGQFFTILPPASATKPRSAAASKTIDTAASSMFNGQWKTVADPGSDTGVKNVQIKPGIDYQVALRRLRKTYGLTLKQAADTLDTYYILPDLKTLVGSTPAEVRKATQGRPLLSLWERQQLIKEGYPPALVKTSMYDIHSYARLKQLMNQREAHPTFGVTKLP